uniref:Uncharacterized protein n=1 Tax=Lepeophtheirus salmonis TaxID=72036 RepID=A0A0K2VD97_LEPSM
MVTSSSGSRVNIVVQGPFFLCLLKI